MKTSRLFIGLALLSLGVTSCKEDYFDQEKYDALLKQSFPVKNIDTTHTWATVGTATANITFNGDYGKDYKVGVYLENPLTAQSVTSLYSGNISSGATISVPVTYPLYVRNVYVAVFDAKGHRLVQSASIENGKINATFGTTAKATRAVESAEVYPQYVKTLSDYLNPVVVQWGNTLNTIQISSIDDMRGYTVLTDQLITSGTNQGNRTLSDMVYSSDGTYYPGHSDGKHFRVQAYSEVREVFHINGEYGKVNDAVIFVEQGAKLHLNGNTLNGPTIVVEGELVIDGTTNMSNAGRFVVLPGGKISGANAVAYNVNNGSACYNGGTIEFQGELNVNGSDFYNNGTINVDVLRNTSGGKFTNFGQITARTNMQAADSYNSTVINGCYMHFTENAGIGTLTMLDNSRLDVDGRAEFNMAHQTLYNLSEINAGALYLNSTTFDGPTTEGQFAVIKTQMVWVGQGADLGVSGNLYFDWLIDGQLCNHQGEQDYNSTVDNGYTSLSYIKSLNLNLVNEASALISIPAGDCTGAGYNPGDGQQEEEEIPVPQEQPQSYRYCFEDNFPEIGDYDFNDAVVTVTPKISGREVELKVTIDAVGATEQLGVAFRVKGVSRGDVASFEQDARFDQDIPVTSFQIIPGEEGLIEEENLTPGLNDIVVKMTSNIHWAVGRTLTMGGMVENYFYNTVRRGDQLKAYRNDVDKPTVTYKFVLGSEDAANQFTQENIDVFIVEGFNGGYWEVHTVPYKTDELLARYASGDKSQYANNFPWAICVPGNFKYPVEWQNVGFKENGVITGAYQTPGHSFGEWAEDQTQATDWYLYPTDGLVYE